MTKTKQEAPNRERDLGEFVRQNLNGCASQLVSMLMQGANGNIKHNGSGNPRTSPVSELMALCDQAAELFAPVLDYEEGARDAGWIVDGGLFVHHGLKTTATAQPSDAAGWENLCNEFDIEPYAWEVYEHWMISDWLAEKLQEKGERIDRDFAGMNVWGRTTTGQAIALDSVICQIYDELHTAKVPA